MGAVRREIRLLLFATAREAVGSSRLRRELPPGGLTNGELLDALVREHPALARLLPHCRVALNGRYVRSRSERLSEGDELAIHPPYSGG